MLFELSSYSNCIILKKINSNAPSLKCFYFLRKYRVDYDRFYK